MMMFPNHYTPKDQTQTFCTPASFVSVNEEERNNHQPTRFLPRNINFVPTQDDNDPNPVGTTRLSMTRMDFFKRRLASTEKSKYRKPSSKIKAQRYNERVDKLLCQAIRLASFNDDNIDIKTTQKCLMLLKGYL